MTGNADSPVTLSRLDPPTPDLASNGRTKTLLLGYCFRDGTRLFVRQAETPEFEDIMAANTMADEPTRRDILVVATGVMGVGGAGLAAWPLIDQMNPDATTLAAASAEADIANIAEGQVVTVKWRGKPIFISHRTPKEIEAARAVPLSELRDPATDESRVQKPEWLVVIGICTHLGCVPLKNDGPYEGGYFCPCHGSVYDASGRIRYGPAPYNLALPPYKFASDTKITIG
jgi:ubiquinol-cytochrome c reductase iron-sulfur subunit